MATYLYGIMGPARLTGSLGHGVGYDPSPLRLVRHGRIAALVSDVSATEPESEGRALRRDLRAHEEVVRRAMDAGAILPVGFGTMFDDDRQLVEELLDPSEHELAALLEQFDGLVELTLKAEFNEDAVIARLLQRDGELRAWQNSARYGGSDEQLAFGQALAEAIEQEAEITAEGIVADLRALAEDLRFADPGRGTGVLKGSFLVDERRLARFDAAVERMVERLGGLVEFDYIGPLPPYSFIHLNLGERVG
jgi:Gas vesicle synthesis protein GvpL/GvpF